MNDEWTTIDGDKLFGSLASSRMGQSKNVPEFDPYQMLLNRKQKGEDTTLPPIHQHNESDVKELEEFCRSHGILSVGFKGMDPKSILRMLKSKIGFKEESFSGQSFPTQKSLLKG